MFLFVGLFLATDAHLNLQTLISFFFVTFLSVMTVNDFPNNAIELVLLALNEVMEVDIVVAPISIGAFAE